MSKIISECSRCHKKNVQETGRSKLGNSYFINLDCGHTKIETGIAPSGLNEIKLQDGRALYPFQVQGVRFLEANNFRGLISDEMGLGKTIQAVAGINLHYEDLKPILCVVKASLTYQWLKEIVSGTGKFAQILDRTIPPVPGIEIFITSYDAIPQRKKRNSEELTGGLVDIIKKLNIKTVILDEVQMLKNHESSRTQAVRDIVRGIEQGHLVGLSGTPVKNNAIEYFPILNLLRPEQFPNRERFIRNDVEFYSDGRTWRAGGLKNPQIFLDKTKDFIIRRTRKEVLPDLPAIQRDYKYYPMMEQVQKDYNKKVKHLAEVLDDMESSDGREENTFRIQGDLLAALQVLRHITGLAKLEAVLDYVEEFLEENPGEKITIFHHHIDVGDLLFQALDMRNPGKVIRMTSSDDSSVRMNKIEEFKNGKAVLIAPTLACGEGLNLQFCSHAILMEREWNPANEEQAEGRFSRIGSNATSILVCYPTATGTIDEFFAELVERKREAVGKTLDGSAQQWNQSTVMRELANLVVKKWRLSL